MLKFIDMTWPPHTFYLAFTHAQLGPHTEHRLIYEAIVTGNADAAAFYVEQHIHRVQRDIAPQ